MGKKENQNGKAAQEAQEMRKIGKKIKSLLRKRNKKIEQIKKGRKSLAISLSDNANIQLYQINQIVKGKTVTEEELGDQSQRYFSKEELEEKQQLMKKKAKLTKFWKVVFNHCSYASLLTQADQSILDKMETVRVLQNDEEGITLEFKIQNHHILKSATFQRSIIYDQSKKPVELSGDKIKKTSKLKEGIFKLLLSNLSSTEYSSTLETINQFMNLICDEIIPYSLEYYLSMEEIENYDESEVGGRKNIEATCPH